VFSFSLFPFDLGTQILLFTINICYHSKMKSYLYGLNEDRFFKKTVEQLVREYMIEEIIETGTYKGLGSTMVFARTNLPVFSIECNGTCVDMARDNLRDYPNVVILHGYSLKQKEIIQFLFQDNLDEKKWKAKAAGRGRGLFFCLRELSCPASAENLLIKLISNNKRQLVFLDSSDGVGWLEFKAFMAIKQRKKKILMLDDVQVVKHSRSVQELKRQGIKFHLSRTKRWGWASF
ncbi:MAG: hypothetical protein NT099_04970, partial [Candidatus Saganbacteria bacterium]|nr:hypothetical protein [Candidatus Saganbacteria bacterium]